MKFYIPTLRKSGQPLSRFRALRLHLSTCGLALILPLIFCAAAAAQGLARISGTVTDTTGAAIPNARLTATRVATGASSVAQSSGNGDYTFPSLAPD